MLLSFSEPMQQVFFAIGAIAVALISPASAQPGGRFEEAKRMGLSYLESEQFDRAAGRLEEVWEQDQSDSIVGELLALAYLNTEDRRALPRLEKQAFAIIHQLVSGGARVSFLVQHSHEKLGWLQGRELNRYCRGRMSISKSQVVFIANKGEPGARHSFERDSVVVRSATLNEDDRRGTFILKLADGSDFFMATRNRNREEARMIVGLLKQIVLAQ